MQFIFEAHGEQLVTRTLLRWEGRALNAQPAFEQIAEQFMRWETRVFDTQGASGGARWDDIADSTKAYKRHHDPPLDPRVLHATLALRKSLTEKGNEHMLFVPTDSFLLFGSKLDYAAFHQKGRGVKQRRPLQFTEAQKKDAIRILQRYLAEGGTARGGNWS